MTNGSANIRPARAEDLFRIAEIEIFNYRLTFIRSSGATRIISAKRPFRISRRSMQTNPA